MAKQHALPYNFRASLTCIFHRSPFDFSNAMARIDGDAHASWNNRSIESFHDSFATRNPANPFNHPPPTPSPWKPYDNWIETNSTIAICFRGRKLLFEIGEKGWNQLWIVARVIHSESFTVFMANCVGCVLTFRVTLLQLHVVQETW